MDYYLLPANPTGYADDFRADTMGVLATAQMGRRVGEVVDTLSDSPLLWSNAILRRILCAAALRHCAVHTSGEPDGDNGKRADDGGLPAKQLLLGGLPDGGKYRGIEVFEPRAGFSGVDDTGR